MPYFSVIVKLTAAPNAVVFSQMQIIHLLIPFRRKERDADKTGSVDGSNVLQQNFKKLFD